MGFRDWSSMLGILESSLGPFEIIFAVPTLSAVQRTPSLSASLKKKSSKVDIIPPPPSSMSSAPSITSAVLSNVESNASAMPLQLSPKGKGREMKHRNSVALAKEAILEAQTVDVEFKMDAEVVASAGAAQQKEFARVESEMNRVSNQNAQLLETQRQ